MLKAAREQSTYVSLRQKLIYSHLTVALFCFLILLAAIVFNIWLGERSKSLATAADPMQNLNLQSINNAIEYSAALIYEDVALQKNINRDRWESVWNDEIWEFMGGIDADDVVLDSYERSLIHQLRSMLVTLENQQWFVVDVVDNQGEFPAQTLLDEKVFHIEQNISQGLVLLIDQEAELPPSNGKIRIIKKYEELQTIFIQISSELNRFAYSADPMVADIIEERRAALKKSLSNLSENKNIEAVQHKLLHWLSGELKLYFEMIDEVIKARKSENWNRGYYILFNKVLPLAGDIDKLINSLIENSANKVELSSQKLSSLVEYNFLLSLLFLFAMLLSAYFSAKYLSNRIVAPVEKLVNAATKLGKHQQVVKISEDGNDELGVLAKAFNEMQNILIQKQEELQCLATIDPLTALANRRRFSEVIDREWKRCLRDGCEISLIMIDVDHFKYFNDQYGHQAGDDALRSVSDAIRGCLRRPSDVAARYGGEEFVVVLPDTGIEGARKIASGIKKRLAEFRINAADRADSPFLSISCGISSCYPYGHKGWENLIRAADNALYQAKANGRNRVCESIFDWQNRPLELYKEAQCIE